MLVFFSTARVTTAARGATAARSPGPALPGARAAASPGVTGQNAMATPIGLLSPLLQIIILHINSDKQFISSNEFSS